MKERNICVNLGVVKGGYFSRHHPNSFMLDDRDWHVERSLAVLGVERIVKEDLYNWDNPSDSYPGRRVRMIEWRVFGRIVHQKGKEINPIVPTRLRRR